MWVLLLILAALAAGENPSTAPAPPAAKSPRVNRQNIDEFVSQLANPKFSVREQATEQLCTLDAEFLPELVQRYRAEGRYEPKRRIRYIIEYIFHRDQIIGRNGFIGIEVWPTVLPEVNDPTSGKTTRGVIIRSVKRGFAAERAGVQDGDMIIAVNDQPIPEDPTTAKFIQNIASNPPGTRISMRVLRPTQPRKLSVAVPADPTQILDGAKLEYMLQDITSQGVWISEVKPGSSAAEAGLKAGETLRLIDGNRITFGANQVQILLRGKAPGSRVNLEMIGTQVVSLNVRLGSRPPEYITDPKDKREAEMRFLEWWQEQGGELSSHREDARQQAVYVMPGPARLVPESAVIP